MTHAEAQQQSVEQHLSQHSSPPPSSSDVRRRRPRTTTTDIGGAATTTTNTTNRSSSSSSTTAAVKNVKRRRPATALMSASATLRGEVVSVALFTPCLLCLLWVVDARGWPPSVFLLLLSLFMLLWDVVGLAGLGSQLNPAVTLAHGLAGKTGLVDSLIRSVIQTVVTLVIVFLLSSSSLSSSSSSEPMPWSSLPVALPTLPPMPPVPEPHPDAHWMHAALFEALATAVLAAIAMSLPHVIDPRARRFTLWLASSLLASGAALAAQDWSGACMNPAFALALALVHRRWDTHFVYWLGPLVGSAFAAVMHVVVVQRLFPLVTDDEEEEEEDVAKEEKEEVKDKDSLDKKQA